jgi:outer membrane murein-binding lipoprotein Lpp
MPFSNTGLRVAFSPNNRAILVAFTAVALLLAGCMSTPQRGALERKLDVDTLSSQQLGLLVGEYANSFADTVKLSADKIATGTSALPPRRAALQWKIKAVPAVFTAASRQDPLFALADVWVLAIQQRELFDREAMAQILGEGQAVAQAASRSLEERIESVARLILKSPEGLATLETFVHRFSAEHPIEDLSFVRDSIAPYYVKFMETQSNLRQQVASVKEYAVTALALALAGLNNVPEMARWQAELTLLDAEAFPAIGRTVASLDALGAIATDLKTIEVDLPVTIDQQRIAVIQDIERQRIDTLRDIELMRRAAFVDLGLEREAVLAGLEKQIQLVLNAVRVERETLTGQIPSVAERAGASVLPLTREVIDYAFWRAVQLSVLLAILLLAVILIARMMRKRDRQ